MRKAFLFPFLVLGTASFACSSSSGNGTPDAGTPLKDTGTADHATIHVEASTMKDTGTTPKEAGKPPSDAASDVTKSDAGPPPTPAGTSIEKGLLAIEGVTGDGYLIYANATTVKAVPEAGGTAITLIDAGEAGSMNGLYAEVLNDDVFIWTNVDSNTGASTLTLWNHTLLSTPKMVSTTSLPFVAAASDDSTAIVFATGVSADGTTVGLSGATITSLATPTSLVAGIDPGGQMSTCPPSVTFSGKGASLYAVVGSCKPAVTDGGTDGPLSVVSFPTATWTGAALATGATAFSIDDTGVSAAITLATGQLEIVPLAGGTPIVIDSGPDGGTALGMYSFLSKKDSFVLYNTSAGALTSSKVTASAPVTLLASGATEIDGLPASEAFALVDTGFDQNTGLLTGLALASTATANTSTAFVTGTDEAGMFGDAFTSDSKYVIYLANITPDDNMDNVGTLTAAAVATPATPITVAAKSGSTNQNGSLGIGGLEFGNLSNFLAGGSSATDYAVPGGSKIVFVDNFTSDNGQVGQVDLKVVDLSTTTAAVTVMKSADPMFALTPDGKYIIYTITFGGATDGLYTVAVP